MKYIPLLFLLATCTSIHCKEWSTAKNMGTCKNETADYGFGPETKFYCQVPTTSGKIAYSTETINTGDRVCVDYIGD